MGLLLAQVRGICDIDEEGRNSITSQGGFSEAVDDLYHELGFCASWEFYDEQIDHPADFRKRLEALAP